MKRFLSTKYSENSWHFGLLILRLAFGGLMIVNYGYDMLIHFSRHKNTSQLFGPPTDAVLMVFAELFCAILVVMGLFTRFALIPLIITMWVAFYKVHRLDAFDGQISLLFFCAYLCLLFTGPGKYSVDKMIAK
jgi:putative oxidoreductase